MPLIRIEIENKAKLNEDIPFVFTHALVRIIISYHRCRRRSSFRDEMHTHVLMCRELILGVAIRIWAHCCYTPNSVVV